METPTKEHHMQDLQNLAVKAGGRAARYSLVLQDLIEAAGTSMRSAHHGSGTEVYHALNYAPDDLHNAADELDRDGRELVAALLEQMKGGTLYGNVFEFRSVNHNFIERRSNDAEEVPRHAYSDTKGDEHPSEWTSPFDWMVLIYELPTILEQLAAPAAA
jgi:hypothetical protein